MNVRHVVEPGGRGGVYQHVLGTLQQEEGRYVLHTARDAELSPELVNVQYCRCMRWQRRGPRAVRIIVSLLWVLFRLNPHLGMVASRGVAFELQGQYGLGAHALTMLTLRLRGAKVVYAPHNLFSRSGITTERLALKISTALASSLIVYHQRQENAFPGRSVEVRRLWQYMPTPSQTTIRAWNSKLESRRFVLFMGQLREDKRPGILVEAAMRADNSPLLVFLGEDKGSGDELKRALGSSKVDFILEMRYAALDELVYLAERAEAVICPYSQASQSGVAALANQLGTKVIASDEGALALQADVVLVGDHDEAVRQLASLLDGLNREEKANQ